MPRPLHTGRDGRRGRRGERGGEGRIVGQGSVGGDEGHRRGGRTRAHPRDARAGLGPTSTEACRASGARPSTTDGARSTSAGGTSRRNPLETPTERIGSTPSSPPSTGDAWWPTSRRCRGGSRRGPVRAGRPPATSVGNSAAASIWSFTFAVCRASVVSDGSNSSICRLTSIPGFFARRSASSSSVRRQDDEYEKHRRGPHRPVVSGVPAAFVPEVRVSTVNPYSPTSLFIVVSNRSSRAL